MDASSTMTNSFAKSARAQTGDNFPQIGETNIRVINKIKEMYQYPATILGRWLGISDKSAKRRLGFERALSAEHLGVLIRSERGFEIVGAIMGDATPAWWRIVVPLMDAADARKMQIAAKRRAIKTIESVLDADRHLTATIERAEALAVSDEEYARPHIDALRSIGRVHGRAMAQTKRGRK